MNENITVHDADPQSNISQQTTTGDRDAITIVLPFKDQKSAKVVKYQLFDLPNKIGKRLNPIFTSRKIKSELKVCERKPFLLSKQCVVYMFKCDQCDAGYVGYTARYLYQRMEEHKTSVVGKHSREIHGQNPSDLAKNFSVLRKCKNKFDCLVHEMLLIKQYKSNLNGQSDSLKSKLF